MQTNMKQLAAAVCAMALIGCSSGFHSDVEFRYQSEEEARALTRQAPPPYPETRFVVLSDPHYHHPDLGTRGPAFQEYLATDRKLLAQSDAVLDAAIRQIRSENADFILVCGDMTKDGERYNHQSAAERLRELLPHAPVYVVPGNHDVLNGEAFRYTPEGKQPVPTVTPAEFRKIYADFGYSRALAADLSTLSYAAEPVPGLWLLALDSCLWRENEPGAPHLVDGRFPPDTLAWIEEMLIRARRKDKAVIAMMHHGLVEHYPSNEKYYGQYVVDGSDAISALLASYGVRLVFTGHFHAQDVTVQSIFPEAPAAVPDAGPRRFLFDIETGSLVTHPCPYRRVAIEGGRRCIIESRFIEAVSGMEAGFSDFAESFVYQGTMEMADRALAKYGVSKAGRQVLSPQVAEAYVAHLEGDEKRPETILETSGTGLMGRLVAFFQKDLVAGWWTDFPPPDNHLTLDLQTGGWQP